VLVSDVAGAMHERHRPMAIVVAKRMLVIVNLEWRDRRCPCRAD
jgi:hypothetical protein